MFYSQFILAKKGPLGTIWIAAHLERKLRKSQVNETNIIASVDSILFPEVPIALRLSGHLLLGVVRIYSRKVNYLLSDCSEALLKIKQAFQKSSVDLPPDALTAPFNSITLPEAFDFDDLEGCHETTTHAFADSGADHVAMRDLITLQDQEDRHRFDMFFTLDDRFPEGGDPYSVLGLNDEHYSSRTSVPPFQVSAVAPVLVEDVLPPLPIDDEMNFGVDKNKGISTPDFETINTHPGVFGPSYIDVSAPDEGLKSGKSYAPKGFTDQTLLTLQGEQAIHAPQDENVEVPDIETLRSAVSGMEHDQFCMGTGMYSDPSKEVPIEIAPEEKLQNIGETSELRHQVLEDNDILNQEIPIPVTLSPATVKSFDPIPSADDMLASILGVRETPALRIMDTPETIEFPQMKRGKRKRKVIHDDKLVLSSDLMKKQLAYVDDIRRVRRKAPCTEKAVQRLVRDHYVEQTCIGPLVTGLCVELKSLYTRIVPENPGGPFNRTPELELGQAEEHVGRDEIRLEVIIDTNNDLATFADAVSPLAQQKEGCYVEKLDLPGTCDLPLEANEAQMFEAPCVVNGKGDETVAAEQAPVVHEFRNDDIVQQEKEFLEAEKSSRQSDAGISPVIEASHAVAGSRMADEDQISHVPLSRIDGTAPNASPPNFLEGNVSHVDSKDAEFLAMDEDDTFESDVINQKRKNVAAENTRWSTRTRAVAQYLRAAFEKMDANHDLKSHQPTKLSLNRLIAGRSRKEASRMFFEALVLKSKDYVHVEQETGFADIYLFPTATLLKGVF